MKKILTVVLLLSISAHAMQHTRLAASKQYLQHHVNLSNLQKVLVVGCGNGDIPALIAKKICGNGIVIALDGSQATIDRIHKKHGTGHAKLTFQREILQKFDLHWPVEVVTSFAALHFMRNQQHVLERIAHALQPDGTFHLIMDGKDENNILHDAVKETIQSPTWARQFKIPLEEVHQPCAKQQLNDMLALAGFDHVVSQMATRNYQFKTKDEFITWILDWTHGMPSIAHLNADTRIQLANEIADNYLKQTDYRKSKNINLTFAVLTAQAKKIQEENQ